MTTAPKQFKLEFSNRVIEHLGIKLYQNKPTNVVAEFLSNCWDADATKVAIELRSKGEGGHPIVIITDNGRGMTRDELTDEFLIIGRNRRTKPEERTPGGRLPMGRKGIGKLAGFGIAKTVDVLSSPHEKLRDQNSNSAAKYYWLRFSLEDLLRQTASSISGTYLPEVIADGVDLAALKTLVSKTNAPEVYDQFLANASAGQGGVCVYLSNTTLKKAMNAETLLQAMGRRFTIAMLKPDFEVKINSNIIKPEKALPPLHDFGFGDWNNLQEEVITINGTERKIRYWVKFVDIDTEGLDWSIEQAGAGIYAHGKIAQDRPFFFGVKGKEILSRYLYGVVEADWLDELPTDVVSTDRRSIDWDTDETSVFHEWGYRKVNSWLEDFRKWRATLPKRKIVERIRKVSPLSKLSGAEEEALAELLNDVLPNLADDDEAKDRATKNFTEAWTHAPTRLLTKNLWEKIFSSLDSDSAVFAALIDNLRESMVPEAMGLAVTMAQRVAAITVMKRMIHEDKTETHLQRLIESFPWLLGPQWERLTANQEIKTLVEKKYKPVSNDDALPASAESLRLKPDFVFLSDAGTGKELIVFELKGPEAGKTLQPNEYQQLSAYLNIISAAYTDPSVTVSGILVGHDKGGFKEYDTRITVKTWAEVLVEARAQHVAYLQALLLVSNPDADDIRIKQISDFGGKETMELLERLAPVGQFPNVIKDSLKALESSEGGEEISDTGGEKEKS